MVRIHLSRRSSTSLIALALVGRSQAFSILGSQLAVRQTSSFASRNRNRNMASSSDTSDTQNNNKRVLVPIGDGSEEIETTCITDTLTRFGADVTIASVMPAAADGNTNNALVCTMSRGCKIMADMSIDDDSTSSEWDLIALPGGMPGAEHLRDSKTLTTLLQTQHDAGKMIGAICASPAVVLAANGILTKDDNATCYPAPPFRAALSNPSNDKVVVTGHLITSQGPGTSLEFALMLGEKLYGKEKADQVAAEMLVER